MQTNRFVASRTGLLIVIPTLGRPISLEWAWAFKSLIPPVNYNTNFMQIFGKPIDVARNEAAEAAIEQNTKYVFFIGDDVVVPPHALKQLIFRMEHDPSLAVVGGIYCSKSNPPAPLVFRDNGAGSYWDWKVGEYFEINGIGMDCTLIRTDVFKKLTKPYFKTVDTDSFNEGINHADQWTEDLYFCKKVVEESGMHIYADAGIICPHLDVLGNKRYTLPEGSYPTRRLSVPSELKKALDIGCGPIDRSNEFPDYHLTRVDIQENCEPDYRVDVRFLPFGNEEFHLVFSSHVLEHFSRSEGEKVLAEWVRVLRPDGTLILILPNIKWAAEQIALGQSLSIDVMNVLYGAQTSEYDYHKNGFTPDSLIDLLKNTFGFKDCKIELSGYNIIVEASRG